MREIAFLKNTSVDRKLYHYEMHVNEGYIKRYFSRYDKKLWQNSDYTNSEHPYFEMIKNIKDTWKVINSYYFDLDALKFLKSEIEKDFNNLYERLKDNPPQFLPDDPLYGEEFAIETVGYKDKLLTNDVIHEEFRKFRILSASMKCIDNEINSEGGLYIIQLELIKD